MSFESLQLDKRIQQAISKLGYENPTPIQEQVIPHILAGKDALAAAQTGTGKTASFTLPLLHLLNQEKTKRVPRCLILTPTRELAAQVHESVEKYGQFLNLKAAVIFGGVKINGQIRQLKSGVDIVIATPGRLLDHVGQKTIDLSKVEVFVLDEADRMLDMGFIRDIRKVLAMLPKKRQNLLFSATFNDEIAKLAGTFLSDPVKVNVSPRNATATTVQQVVHPVERPKKRHLLVEILEKHKGEQTLVFTRSKHGADRLARQLSKSGFAATAIHGGKAQNARKKALSGFKQGRVKVLVATDIAARGLDIDDLSKVVNFDLPQVPEDYVHRIGRTGRAGRNGLAISLVTADDKKMLAGIERFVGRKIPFEVIPGHQYGEPSPDQPRGGNRRSRSGGTGQGRKSNTARGGSKGRNQNRRSSKNSDEKTPSRNSKPEGKRVRTREVRKPNREPVPFNARRFVVPSGSVRDSKPES